MKNRALNALVILSLVSFAAACAPIKRPAQDVKKLDDKTQKLKEQDGNPSEDSSNESSTTVEAAQDVARYNGNLNRVEIKRWLGGNITLHFSIVPQASGCIIGSEIQPATADQDLSKCAGAKLVNYYEFQVSKYGRGSGEDVNVKLPLHEENNPSLHTRLEALFGNALAAVEKKPDVNVVGAGTFELVLQDINNKRYRMQFPIAEAKNKTPEEAKALEGFFGELVDLVLKEMDRLSGETTTAGVSTDASTDVMKQPLDCKGLDLSGKWSQYIADEMSTAYTVVESEMTKLGSESGISQYTGKDSLYRGGCFGRGEKQSETTLTYTFDEAKCRIVQNDGKTTQTFKITAITGSLQGETDLSKVKAQKLELSICKDAECKELDASQKPAELERIKRTSSTQNDQK